MIYGSHCAAINRRQWIELNCIIQMVGRQMCIAHGDADIGMAEKYVAAR